MLPQTGLEGTLRFKHSILTVILFLNFSSSSFFFDLNNLFLHIPDLDLSNSDLSTPDNPGFNPR